MTLNTIKTDLFSFFATHDTFSIEENFDDLYILTEKKEKPFKIALIEKVLEEYEVQKIVTKIEYDGQKTWVLNKPIEQYSQTLELNYPTLAALTKLVNDYCNSIKNETLKVDPLNVTEANVQTILLIMNEALRVAANE